MVHLGAAGAGEAHPAPRQGECSSEGTRKKEGFCNLRVGESLPTTGRLKRLLLPSQPRLATRLDAGTPLEPLATILEWKLSRRTRLIAVPKGNSARGLGNPQGQDLNAIW